MVTGYEKIIRSIVSSKTKEQLKSCNKMIELYENHRQVNPLLVDELKMRFKQRETCMWSKTNVLAKIKS